MFKVVQIQIELDFWNCSGYANCVDNHVMFWQSVCLWKVCEVAFCYLIVCSKDSYRTFMPSYRNIALTNMTCCMTSCFPCKKTEKCTLERAIYDRWQVQTHDSLKTRLTENDSGGCIPLANCTAMWQTVFLQMRQGFSLQLPAAVLKAMVLMVSRPMFRFPLKVQWTRQFRVSKEINVGCLFKTKVWKNRTV